MGTVSGMVGAFRLPPDQTDDARIYLSSIACKGRQRARLFFEHNSLRLDDVGTARMFLSLPMIQAEREDGETKASAQPRPISSVERIEAERMTVNMVTWY